MSQFHETMILKTENIKSRIHFDSQEKAIAKPSLDKHVLKNHRNPWNSGPNMQN